MTVVIISREARRPLEVGRFARNTLPPTARFQKQLAELAGSSALCRGKVVFRSAGSMVIPDSAALGVERTRGRFAWHTGPYANLIQVRFVLAQQNNGAATAPYARLRVTNTAGTVVGDAYGRFGAATSASDVPGRFGVRTSYLVSSTNESLTVYLDPDTDYFATISEHDYARIQSIEVHEISVWADTDNGFTAIPSPGGPIIDTDRSAPLRMARSLYRSGGAHLWNWYAETDALAPVFSTATYTNIIDTTITDVSSFRPGATIDLRSHSRLKDGSNVPVVMKVYANGTNGVVRIRDSSGTAMMSATVNAGAGWYVIQGMLPNALAKYDLHAAALTGTMTVYAVSIYQGDAAIEQLAATPAYMRMIVFDGTASMS